MKQDSAPQDQPHDRFDDLLIELHEALAAGQDLEAFLNAASPGISPQLRSRLAAAGSCVRDLHAAWHGHEASEEPSGEFAAAVLERVGRFQIVRELGRGGGGAVLLGIDPQLGRRVAIKVPLPEVLVQTDLRQRFLREAEVAARLRHPNLLAVYESGEYGPLCYIASEYCAGPNLAEWLNAHRHTQPPSMAAIASLMLQLADAVHHAHARGVLHRDLKPSNILLDPASNDCDGLENVLDRQLPDYIPKVADFGLAKLVENDEERTRTGVVLGTLLYMSPEQASGRIREISVQSDVYALGAILYELLTRRPPLSGESDHATLTKIIAEEPVQPRRISPEVPRDLEAICLKCLEKLPAARYATAAELAADLRRHSDGRAVLARTPSAAERVARWMRRRPIIAALSALLVAALGTIIAGGVLYNARLSGSIAELKVQRETAEARAHEAREYAYGTEMLLAQQAWERSAPAEAIALLDRQIPREDEFDFRRFEWYSLRNRFAEESTLVADQGDKVWSLAAARNLPIFATGDPKGVVRLWNRNSKTMIRELRGHGPGFIDGLAFTKNGKELVSAGDDHTIRWWDVATGANTQVWKEHQNWVGALAMSRGGHWLVSGDGDGRVLLWNVDDRSLDRELPRHAGAVRWIAISPKKPWYIISACEAGEVRIWDLDQGAPPERFPSGMLPIPEGKQAPSWRNAVFRDDGRILAAGDRARVYLWNLAEWDHPEKILQVVPALTDKAMALGTLDRLDLLVEGGDTLPTLATRRWKATDSTVHTLRGHQDSIRCLVGTFDSHRVLTGSEDGQVREWNFSRPDPDGLHIPIEDTPTHLAWSPNSDRLWVTTQARNLLSIDDLSSPTFQDHGKVAKETDRLLTYSDKEHFLGFDRFGNWLDRNGDGITTRPGLVPTDQVLPQVDPAARFLAYKDGNSVVLLNASNGQRRWSQPLGSSLRCIYFLTEDFLIVGTEGGVLLKLATEDGRVLAQSKPQAYSIVGISASANKKRLLTISRDQKITLLAADTFEAENILVSADELSHVWFVNSDERLLAFGQKYISVLNPRTGQTLLRFPRMGRDPAISPDGRWLAVSGNRAVWLRQLVAD